MKVILRNTVEGLGRKGDICEVADGYARNFLIPKGMAERSTAATLKAWEGRREKLQQEAEEKRKQASGLAERMEGLEITLKEKAGEEGQLFGSVNAAKLCAALKEAGFEVDAAAPRLGEPIKKTGEYEVDIRVASDARVKVKVTVKAEGDLHIDFHHTTEDTGIAIGEAVDKALGERRGITRYGSALAPMDEALTRVSLDASNRPYLVWKVDFARDKLGKMDTELFKEWFQAFAQAAGLTLHVETLYGDNNHHIVESCFKALARALRQAIEVDPRHADMVPSTKGTLGGTL